MSNTPSVKSKEEKETVRLTDLQQKLVHALDYEELMNCMRCGFCQPSCPTYQETGLEAASPRGRIALMKAVADGIMEPDDSFQKQMNLCLGCRACEPVCPSDVKYGHLLEQTKEVLYKEEQPSAEGVSINRVHRMLKPVFRKHKRLLFMSKLLTAYQRTGLQRLATKCHLLRLLPLHLQTMERILPKADSAGVIHRVGGHYFEAQGKRIGTVGMFRGCIMDVLFTETNVNTVRLLIEAGYDVVIPETQACCGALFSHGGDRETATEFAIQNIKAFQETDIDCIASNAGGCGAMLIEYDHLLADDPEWSAAAQQFTGKVKDISDLLLRSAHWDGLNQEMNTRSSRASKVRVTYQDSCHLRNVMKAGHGPRELLRLLSDIDYVELEGAELCCGSAGTYNLMQPKMANAVLDRKMEAVQEAEASILLTSNPGCLLQMKAGVEREQSQDQLCVMHVVDYFAEKVLE